MSFKFELHCHTAETSYCASCKASESVALLKKHGYDGVAITNHYYGHWFDTRKDEKTWEEKMNVWISGYRNAKKAGDAIGFSAVLGVEIGFDIMPDKHFLCYGMDEDFFFEYPELYKMTPAEFYELANARGFFFCQAHPRRHKAYTFEPASILHGMEFYNSHGENYNDETYEEVKKNNLVGIVGSDFHHEYQMGKTAVLLPKLVKDSKELANLLLNNQIDGYILNTDNIPEVFKQDNRFICVEN